VGAGSAAIGGGLFWTSGVVVVAGGVSRDKMTLDVILLFFAGAGKGELVGDSVSLPGMGGMGRGGSVGPRSSSVKVQDL
jgi:hypothetical protein